MACNILKTLILYVFVATSPAHAQSIRSINDKHIQHQHERMVYKQWDRDKFTPTKGFLGLNYQYWLTWGLHPNYPKLDRRPLSADGPQTLRIGFALAMKASAEKNKLHMDTLRNISLGELSHISALGNSADPLWILYYKQQLAPLMDSHGEYDPFKNITATLLNHLKEKGVYDWFIEEHTTLKERLQLIWQTDMERGSRILSYHRILGEFRKLISTLDSKIEYSRKYLLITKGIQKP